MCHKNNSVIPKTYNESITEQVSICSVRLRHKDKTAKYIFFVVSGDGPALLRVPGIDVLDILKIMYEIIGNSTGYFFTSLGFLE